jgi:hypothetical protein
MAVSVFQNSKKAEREFAQTGGSPKAIKDWRSKTSQDCRRHLAKEPPGQARMVLQHDGAIDVWPSGIHLSHITIAAFRRNEAQPCAAAQTKSPAEPGF